MHQITLPGAFYLSIMTLAVFEDENTREEAAARRRMEQAQPKLRGPGTQYTVQGSRDELAYILRRLGGLSEEADAGIVSWNFLGLNREKLRKVAGQEPVSLGESESQ